MANEEINIKELLEVLKRNEPMRVDLETSLNGTIGCFYCPECEETLRRSYNYCPDCGQRLDWSEQNDKRRIKH